jgi:ribose-phosphate pyrophosphokinase
MLQEMVLKDPTFFTPVRFTRELAAGSDSPRGRLLIACCRSGAELSHKVALRYKDLLERNGDPCDVLHLANVDLQFSDTETCARLDIDVSGDDVYLFQALLDPTSRRSIDQNYIAFLVAVRTFREWGANHVTGVLPYLAYARQDKPTRFTREPTTAKLMADLSISAGIDRLITWDPHCMPIHGFYGHVPITNLESMTLFSSVYRRFKNRQDVILIAPDAGASKFVTYVGRMLNLNCAIASKDRPIKEEVVVSEVIGDFSAKRVAIILDDMISSGGTVYELVKKLVTEKGIEEVYLGVSHNLCRGLAHQRLMELYEHYHLKELVITNSIPQTEGFRSLPFISIFCLSDILARVINRIHYNRSISDLFG